MGCGGSEVGDGDGMVVVVDLISSLLGDFGDISAVGSCCSRQGFALEKSLKSDCWG